MDGIEPDRKRITLSDIVRYFFGLVFLLFSIVHLSSMHYIAGVFFIFAAVITVKPVMNLVEKKFNVSISGAAKFFVVFCLVVIALAAVPNPPTAVNSTETIASSTTAINDAETTVKKTESTPITQSYENSINVVGTYYKCGSWSNEQYPLITLFGENYVPLLPSNEHIWNARVNKLAKLIIDLPNEGEKYALRSGEILDLGQGYGLEAKQIDVDGQMVWFELTKDGSYIDSEIIKVGNGSGGTWSASLNDIQGVSNIVVFKVHVNNIFEGAVDSIVQIDGIWLIDYVNATTLKVGDNLGNVTLMKINSGVDKSNLGSLVFEPSVTSVEHTTLEPEKEVTSAVVASWKGESTKNTETFHISSNEWKIKWKTNPGQYGDMNFQIYVYNSDGSLKDVAANVIGESTDSTIMRGAGDYYLKINTAQPYAIEIQE